MTETPESDLGDSNAVSSSSGAIPRPEETSPEMTAAQLAEAKEYGHRELICSLLDRGLDIAYLSVAAFVLARPLDHGLAQWPFCEPMWVRLIAMYLSVTLLHMAVSFPLSFYSGHMLEHRYGMSRQSVGGWFKRYFKRNGLTLAFGVVMTLGLYSIIWTVGAWWWLAAAAAFFLVSVLLGQLAPVLILPLFYKITRLEDESLTDRLRSISEGTGLDIEGVYRMAMSDETAKANAMLAGIGSTRRVILGDTLLDGFSEDEIGVIFAHEVGHHVHRHIPKMILAGLVYSTFGFWVADFLLGHWVAQIEGQVDYASFPVYTLPALTLLLTLLGQLLEPLQNMVSRFFERQSDWYALERMKTPEVYRSAFHKLARLNKSDPDPHPLEVFLFHSHPPIAQRLAMADRCPGRE